MSILPLISAYGFGSFDISRGPTDVINFVKDFTSPFFEALLNTSAYSEFFFAKCLLLILVFITVYFVLQKIDFLELGSKKGILLIISTVISVLGLRYLPDNDFIKGILLPYNVLGLAITIFLPFLIYFFFVEKSVQNPAGRRFGWIAYAIIFGVLWANRYAEISQMANYVYLAGLIVVILCLIFDKSLHQYFQLKDFRKSEDEIKFWNRIKLTKKIQELYEAYERGSITKNEYEKRKKIMEERLKELV